MKAVLKAQQVNKSDRNDARGIAQMMRDRASGQLRRRRQVRRGRRNLTSAARRRTAPMRRELPRHEAVMSLVERGGRVRSHHVPNVSATTLRPILVETDPRIRTSAPIKARSTSASGRDSRATPRSTTRSRNTFVATRIPTRLKATFRSERYNRRLPGMSPSSRPGELLIVPSGQWSRRSRPPVASGSKNLRTNRENLHRWHRRNQGFPTLAQTRTMLVRGRSTVQSCPAAPGFPSKSMELPDGARTRTRRAATERDGNSRGIAGEFVPAPPPFCHRRPAVFAACDMRDRRDLAYPAPSAGVPRARRCNCTAGTAI